MPMPILLSTVVTKNKHVLSVTCITHLNAEDFRVPLPTSWCICSLSSCTLTNSRNGKEEAAVTKLLLEALKNDKLATLGLLSSLIFKTPNSSPETSWLLQAFKLRNSCEGSQYHSTDNATYFMTIAYFKLGITLFFFIPFWSQIYVFKTQCTLLIYTAGFLS